MSKRITAFQLAAMEGLDRGEIDPQETDRRVEELVAEVQRLQAIIVSMDEACEAACKVPEGGKILFLSHRAPDFFAEARAIRNDSSVAK